jgi:hypothetical protein
MMSVMNLEINNNTNNNSNNTNNNTNNDTNNNRNNNSDNSNITSLFNRFDFLLNLSRLRRENNAGEEDNTASVQHQNNFNNINNNEEGPPLSFSQLQNLPSFNYNMNNNIKEKCIICGIVFSYNDIVVKLRCNHIFHKNCLTNRLVSRRSSKCPNCKNSII